MSNKRCRLILSPPASGSWNMAVDETLLESTADSGNPTLRFYRWSEPTLSLGYFQPVDDRRRHAQSTHCPVVRRATGGGAIVHDVELTYSLALARDDLAARSAEQLYARVHEALISALDAFKVEATIHNTPPSPNERPAFLCFKRRAPYDVLIDEHKIAGSAQRRRGNAVLQHGSILLAQSVSAPQLPGIQEISGRQIDTDGLIDRLLASLGTGLSLAFEQGEPTDVELQRASGIERDRYLANDWTSRR